MTDEEFKTTVLVKLAKIESEFAGLKVTDKKQDERIVNLELSINGNGKAGIAEKVRFIEWKFGAIALAVYLFGDGIFRIIGK